MYKIPCANCSWCYIGETGRAFNTRNVKTAAEGSKIANHAWSHDQAIDFENTSIIDKGGSLEQGRHWLPMRTTIHVHYLDNTTFFSTNIHDYLHFSIVLQLQSHAFYSFFFSSLASCHSHFTRRKTVFPTVESLSFFNRFSQRLFLKFFTILK